MAQNILLGFSNIFQTCLGNILAVRSTALNSGCQVSLKKRKDLGWVHNHLDHGCGERRECVCVCERERESREAACTAEARLALEL
jgi:hypothetical protein